VSSRLNLEALARLPAVVRRQTMVSATWVSARSLGLGAFSPAHQAVYTEDALRSSGGDWGILGASLRHADVPNGVAAQQQLYTGGKLSAACAAIRSLACVRASLTANHTTCATAERLELAANAHLSP